MNPLVDQGPRLTIQPTPLREGERQPVQLKIASIALIICLLNWRCPFNITRLIMPVNINPLNRGALVRGGTDGFIKLLKRLEPKLNPATTIKRIAPNIRIKASCPRPTISRIFATFCESVSPRELSRSLTLIAPAGLRVSASQVVRRNDGERSAITTAKPHRMRTYLSVNGINSQAGETLADQVKESSGLRRERFERYATFKISHFNLLDRLIWSGIRGC